MRSNLPSPRLLGLLVGLLSGALAGVAAAELATTKDVAPRLAQPSGPRISPEPVTSGELRLQCWQEGVEIIDQRRLQGLSINDATRRESVSLKREGDGQASVFLLPLADGLCLIQPAE